MQFRQLLYLTFASIVLISCDEKKNQAEPDLGFTKIIGSQVFEGEFHPWDIKQLPDDGLFVLASSNTSALKDIHFIKTDKNGDFEWEFSDSSDFKNPVPVIIEKENQFYIFATHQITLTTHLLQIDTESHTLIDLQTYDDFLYPISASEVPNGYIVECFDRDAQRIRLMKLNSNFEEQWRERYSVYEDPIQFNDHLLLSSPLPFFCGHVGTENSASYYFMGGMYNYTLTTMFVNTNDGSLHKRITGFRYDAGVSALLNTNDNNFFLVKHNIVGENSIIPNFEIDLSNGTTLNSQNTDDIPEEIDLQLPTRVRTILKKMTINETEVIVQMTETKSQETLINIYDYDCLLLASKKIGIDTPYLAGNLTSTSDGGLAILSKTYISGRIARIAIVKFSPEEVKVLF